MSNIDAFDITVSQLQDFAAVSHEELDAYACIDKYLVLTTWCLFGNQPTVCMVAYGPTADEEMALRYACRLDHNDLCANRMGISRIGNHYEVWHVVEDPISTLSMDENEGEGVSNPVYQRYELESYLGEFVDDYDVDAIEHDVTKYDPIRGCLVWTVFGDQLADVCALYECLAESVDEIEPEPVDWFGEMGDTLGDYPDEYTRAIAEMF